jgi:FAD/FMN-containing dehydrogenase
MRRGALLQPNLTTQERAAGEAVRASAALPYCSEIVNDVHARLNATQVRAIVDVRCVDDVRDVLRRSAPNEPVCIAGGRHAMGGQQFAEGAILLDTRRFDRVLRLDAERGLVEVESGIQWPALIQRLAELQAHLTARWTIRQKQTGADRLSVGGALSANVHGRGLTMCPIVADVDSFTLIDASGELRRCSRTENAELFRLAIGGYGLFGFIANVTLRLVRRRRLRREVQLLTSDRLGDEFGDRIKAGCMYGDFQFAVDPSSPDFLHRGILSSYLPVEERRRRREAGVGLALSAGQWRQLLFLAHVDKTRAFDLYAAHYLATSGQEYWSDEHQLSFYLDDYHADVDPRLAAHGYAAPGTEMITELFVPLEELETFLTAAREALRRTGADVVYGTVRLIERDDETFLPWARQRSACVILNLHTPHTPNGLARTAEAFHQLIDCAIDRRGSYYLTYHRYACRDQLLACHPRLPVMLEKKRAYDPGERFQSEWYRGIVRQLAMF